MEVRTFETADADPRHLQAARSLMDRAFVGDFSDDDWAHSIGGWHVVAVEDDSIVAHASVVPRSIEVDKRSFRTGYVEAVATDPARQGHGLGTAVMQVIGELIATHHQLGALSTWEHRFYERLGWERWQGPTYVRDGDATLRTVDDDNGIMVLRVGPSLAVDLRAAISCDRRIGDDW